MLKKTVISLLLMIMLAGCAAVPQEMPAPTPSLTVDNAPETTATSTPVPTEIKPTHTPMPSLTPTATRILPLQKVLLTSYFDSPTPTFDAARAVTVTPAKAAVCPEINPDVVYEEGIFWKDMDMRVEAKLAYMLDYLNQGGSMEPILEDLEYSLSDRSGYRRAYYGDLNGDDIPELIMMFYGGPILGKVEFFGCKNGEYDNFFTIELDGMSMVDIVMIKDMNLDGLPEVLLRLKRTMGTRYKSTYEIFSWDGSSFKSLVSQTEFDDDYGLGGVWRGDIRINGLGGEFPYDGNPWEVQDIDQNGTLELIIRGGIETHWEFIRHGPYQPLMQVYTWNGEGFVMDNLQIGPPEYRFQAVFNGDLYTLLHEFERAEASYRQAIDDPNLLWWTDESEAYIGAQLDSVLGDFPTPTMSAPDDTEYPNLAAYAQYRIVLLHLLQGQLQEAEEAYEAMLTAYPVGEEGHIFVQLAERLLGEYRASGDVRAACGEVVEFAAMHEDEVLQYVGGYHGWQALEYEVEDVCPFK